MPSSLARDPTTMIHPRRESFKHGLLPILRLIFFDLAQTLIPLKLILETFTLILHSDSKPLIVAKLREIDYVDPDIVLFLYIQSYKSFLLRTHKNSVVVADVWPSIFTFDDYLLLSRCFSDFVDLIQKILVLVLNAIQLVSGHNRWGVASHVDEEACGEFEHGRSDRWQKWKMRARRRRILNV
ncbi:hypothetical protein JHK82_016251 [Glycine max]|nr:hypothetical protein JHK85_016658 [Glycine max]KAG5046882.1 hypothetical protein JHK86_016288 [Glycine max]KAG5149370.1 hypothetical protein JHK82_016251 [Glycine max]